ncbi:hemolysin family protein [Corynebacterium halotolerans]|uniref:Transporter n=1 Tax=Corynebacterium halotolerans YIM 70093 = DSM 44683 TaxID=1121362 RepID=M1NX68_9CORY|nr:hemolysin family protein [Corynebacterium halotolerans]AGF72085.1 transporter [Corynebacterium halotolerans YIM 70093 = DSM 44683]
MGGIALNALLVVIFVIIGGVFAATEMALVSLRESQIRKMERGTGAGRKVATLARDSGLFLSAVQIGVTFAGFFSSAFGASTIAPQIAPILEGWGFSEGAASITALVVMTLIVSYLSLVLGELVPKRMAMQKAESFSLIVAPPLGVFATLMRPVIWIVNSSSNLLLRALGFDPNARTEEMSNEEVRDIVTSHGGFDPSERELVTDVFEAGDRLVGEVMRHRSDMIAYDGEQTVDEVAADITGRPYSRYPVYEDSIDMVIGFIHVRDLLEHAATGRSGIRIRQLIRPILQLPGTAKLPKAMSQMRASGHHIAIVVDEYGGTDGMVTLEDLLEELVGEIWDEYDREERRAVMALHESRLLDAGTNLEDFADATGITLPEGPYETVAGWMITQLGRLGREGDTVPVPASFTADAEDDENPGLIRYQLEVAEISGNRIIRVELRKAQVETVEPGETTGPESGSGGEPAGS